MLYVIRSTDIFSSTALAVTMIILMYKNIFLLLSSSVRMLADVQRPIQPSIKRLGTLLLLFDVYLTWSSIESLPDNLTSSSPVPKLPILAQYAFYLLLCTLSTLAQHLAIRVLAGTGLFRSTTYSMSPSHSSINNGSNTPGNGVSNTTNHGSRANSISTAIFVSSCMKLFPILMVVWRYDDVGGQVGRGVQWAVALQNLEALRILLGCSYIRAGALVGAGASARWFVQKLMLGAFGLGEVANGLVAAID